MNSNAFGNEFSSNAYLELLYRIYDNGIEDKHTDFPICQICSLYPSSYADPSVQNQCNGFNSVWQVKEVWRVNSPSEARKDGTPALALNSLYIFGSGG